MKDDISTQITSSSHPSKSFSVRKLFESGLTEFCQKLFLHHEIESANFLQSEEGKKIIIQMKRNKLEVLDLNHKKIGNNGISLISEMLTFARDIKEIDLSSNDISIEGLKKLNTALLRVSNLESLNLSGNRIEDDGMEYIGRSFYLDKKLKFLDLSRNRIGDEGAFWIAEIISKNSTLKVIDISRNNIDDAGMFEIFKAVEKHPSIKSLGNYKLNPFSQPELLRMAKENGWKRPDIDIDLKEIKKDEIFVSEKSGEKSVEKKPVLSILKKSKSEKYLEKPSTKITAKKTIRLSSSRKIFPGDDSLR